MANTLTIEEFNYMKDRGIKIAVNNFIKLSNQLLYGVGYDCDIEEKALRSLLYAEAFETWEQDRFNSINFTNYLNSNAIQSVYKELIKLA